MNCVFDENPSLKDVINEFSSETEILDLASNGSRGKKRHYSRLSSTRCLNNPTIKTS